MSSAEDAWLALKNEENEASNEYRKRSTFRQMGGKSENIDDIMRSLHMKEKKSNKTKKSKNKKKGDKESKNESSKKKEKKISDADTTGLALVKNNNRVVLDDDEDDEDEAEARDEFLDEITIQELMQKISRDINILSDSPNPAERRAAINRVHDIITCQGKLGSGFKKLTAGDYNEVFQSISKPIFKRFADPVERCRERALRITNFLFSHGADFVPILGYFFPVLMARSPPRIGYDEDMKVFITNFDQHEEYRRGRAVDRQDKPKIEQSSGALTHTVVEESEEVRLIAVQSLLSLILRLKELDSLAVLNPYFADLILFLQCQTRDLFPEVKVISAKALETLALLPEFESGMCYFAVALVRILLPLLRHRHAKVRIAGIDALRACMIVPNRAKRKGAGTDAMVDLVGFKEDNVLNIASFYKPNVSINYLAELTSDPIVHVRERVVVMLSSFLVDLEDRYDHQQRLVPYLLDMLTDESPSVADVALSTLGRCGQLYEEQHTDDIIERRQFGIDGDDRCNFDKSLPKPFTERPRIGVRMYTRGNTKRFLFALVGELTNWQSKTRLKSANLLKMVTVLCEEYLTMEMHKLLPSYIKALQYAREDGDKDLESILLEVYELAGRYTAPDSYVHFILPRLRGDLEVTQFGMDVMTRCCVIDVLRCFLDGSKSTLIPPYLSEIIDVVVDPFVIDLSSNKLHSSALNLMNMILSKVQGKGLAMTAAHFQTTGRLKNMKDTLHKAFQFIFYSLGNPDLSTKGAETLLLLSNLDEESRIIAHGVQGLMLRHVPTTIRATVAPILSNHDDEKDNDESKLDVDDIFEIDSPETRLIELSLLCPAFVLHNSKSTSAEDFLQIMNFLVVSTAAIFRSMQSSLSSTSSVPLSLSQTDSPLLLLHKYADFFLYFLYPFISTHSPDRSIDSLIETYFGVLSKRLHPPAESEKNNSLLELKRNFKPLVNNFVAVRFWDVDASLQKKRLRILSSLLRVVLVPDNADKMNQITTLPVLKNLMDFVFRSSLSPSTPTDIRVEASHIFKSLLEIFYDESRRLISYSKQQANDNDFALSAEGQEAILSAISVIMNVMLDDSSDTVRILALESLMYVIRFVRPHYDCQESDIMKPPKPVSTNDLKPFVPTSTSFEGMTDALLMRVINGSPTEEFLNQLDFVLRSLAVLNLSVFEKSVRNKLPLLVGLHQPPSAASDLFSGLLDHTEMLMQFSGN